MPNIVDLVASVFVITAKLDWTVAVILVAEMIVYGQCRWSPPFVSMVSNDGMWFLDLQVSRAPH